MKEIKYTISKDEFSIHEELKYLTLKTVITFLFILLFLYIKEQIESQVIWYIFIAALMYAFIHLLMKMYASYRNIPLVRISKNDNIVEITGDKVAQLSDIRDIVIEEEISSSDSGPDSIFILGLETETRQLITIHDTQEKKALMSSASKLAEFLQKEIIDLNVQESIQRSDARKYHRLVDQFESKFANKTDTELHEILAQKYVREDFAIEAVERILSSRNT